MNLVHIEKENNLKHVLDEKSSHEMQNVRVKQETANLEAAHKELLTASGKLGKIRKIPSTKHSPIVVPSPPIVVPPPVTKHISRKIHSPIDFREPSFPILS